MKKLLIRLRTCWRIITKKDAHWVIINLDQENFINILQERDFDCQIAYHGLQPFIVHQMIKRINDLKDETDMLLEKIYFQSEAEYRAQLKESK